MNTAGAKATAGRQADRVEGLVYRKFRYRSDNMQAVVPARAVGQKGRLDRPEAAGDPPCPALQPCSQLQTPHTALHPCLQLPKPFCS